MEQFYEPPQKTAAEIESNCVTQAIHKQVPPWTENRAKPCGCGVGANTTRDCDLGSDGFAWEKQCVKCHKIWVNYLEG